MESGDIVQLVANSAKTDDTVALAGQKLGEEIIIRAQDAVTNIDFFLLVLVALTVCFFTSQSWTISNRFYRHLFKDPMRSVGIEIIVAICDIMMASSLIYYVWNFQNPAPGDDTNWYVSIYALWVAIQGFKWFWSMMFWRFGWSTIGLGFAFVWSMVITVSTLVLAILYAVRTVWPSFALALVVAIIYFLFIIFNGYVFWYAFKGTKPARARLQPRDETMLEQRQSNIQLQQQQRRFGGL